MVNLSCNFEDLLSSKEDRCYQSLDCLVEDLNERKMKTVSSFLNHEGSEDFLWALASMVSSTTQRVASNAAYVIGSLAESEVGSQRVLSIARGKKGINILQDLTKLLTCEDSECIMNAAGTLGTLAECSRGREWMLRHSCLDETIGNITQLLTSENQWTASNAALVLARLTISESGCRSVLDHEKVNFILTKLIQSLGNDTAGRGMNAAFAIGRLLDISEGKEMLLQNKYLEKMITSLCRMLSKGDTGSAKNACFAISCLAREAEGNLRVLNNPLFEDVFLQLIEMLNCTEDSEAAWFSAMTLRTIGSHKKGLIKLRTNKDLETSLTNLQKKGKLSSELREEVNLILSLLKRLDAPSIPTATSVTSSTVTLSWQPVMAESGLDIFKLICGTKVVYKGSSYEYKVEKLLPFTDYVFQLQACTVGDNSPLSDKLVVRTDEDIPSVVSNLHIVGVTSTQIKLGWLQPSQPNGVLKGYAVFMGDRQVDLVADNSYIFTRLSPATDYSISVTAINSQGHSPKATISCTTNELGAHAPDKPNLTVIGRNEIHVSWSPPDVLIGRFFRYELSINSRVYYQGTDRVYRATGLTPGTEYVFVVTAITSEGRIESEPSRKRTPKDTPQNEPGHHTLKTHSFKAKEFQAMQEKSKTQPSIQLNKGKTQKRNTKRPSSSISSSNMSESSSATDGFWALKASKKKNIDLKENTSPLASKIPTSAVIGGGLTTQTSEESLPTDASTSPKAITNNLTSSLSKNDTSHIHVRQSEVFLSHNKKGENLEVVDKRFNEDHNLTIHRNYMRRINRSLLSKEKQVLKPNNDINNNGNNLEVKRSKKLKPEKEYLSLNLPKEDPKQFPDINQYYSDIRSPLENIAILEELLSSRNRLASNGDMFGSTDSLNVEPGTHRSLDSILDTARKAKKILDQKSANYSDSVTNLVKLPKEAFIDDRVVSYLRDAKSIKHNLAKTSHRHHRKHRSEEMNDDSAKRSNKSAKEQTVFKPTVVDAYCEDMASTTSLYRPTKLLPLRNAGMIRSSQSHRSKLKKAKSPPTQSYWSDQESYPIGMQGKSNTFVNLPGYRKFVGAHRPTKSIKQETSNEFWTPYDFSQKSNNINFEFPQPARTGTEPGSLRKHQHPQIMFKQSVPDKSKHSKTDMKMHKPYKTSNHLQNNHSKLEQIKGSSTDPNILHYHHKEDGKKLLSHRRNLTKLPMATKSRFENTNHDSALSPLSETSPNIFQSTANIPLEGLKSKHHSSSLQHSMHTRSNKDHTTLQNTSPSSNFSPLYSKYRLTRNHAISVHQVSDAV